MMISFFSLAIVGGLWAPLSSFPRPSLPSDACCRRSASPTWAGRVAAGLTAGRSSRSRSSRPGPSPSVASRRGDTDPPNSRPVADDRLDRSARRPGRHGLGVVRVRCPDERPGRWIPLWRVVGIVFVAYPIVRIVASPPEPLVTVARAGRHGQLRLPDLDPGTPTARRPATGQPDPGRAGCRHHRACAPRRRSGRLTKAGSRSSTTRRPPRSLLLPERRALGHRRLPGWCARRPCRRTGDPASAIVQGLSVSVIGHHGVRDGRPAAKQRPVCTRPARSWRHGPSPTSAIGSRATCTTCSATACP